MGFLWDFLHLFFPLFFHIEDSSLDIPLSFMYNRVSNRSRLSIVSLVFVTGLDLQFYI